RQGCGSLNRYPGTEMLTPGNTRANHRHRPVAGSYRIHYPEGKGRTKKLTRVAKSRKFRSHITLTAQSTPLSDLLGRFRASRPGHCTEAPLRSGSTVDRL